MHKGGAMTSPERDFPVIAGIQRLTLIDYPGRIACTVFLAGCNFRCPFCQNAALLDGGLPEPIQPDIFLSFLKKRRGLLSGVCVSGGEPLLHPGLKNLLLSLKELGYAVKVDTNGSDPDRLKDLCREKLIDAVAMDIKAAPEKYPAATGTPGLAVSPVLESAAFLMEGRLPYEFRTTVVEELHDDGDFYAIGRWLAGARRYFLQGFEDRGGNLKPGLHACSPEKMKRYLNLLKQTIPAAQIRGQSFKGEQNVSCYQA